MDFNEVRTPLTAPNVQAWARANFPPQFRALPRAARLQWIECDESFTISRAIWRSLGRSSHKQLLVIGGYAPGAEVEEPTDRVTAHVHADEAEVSFYRIAENADGSNELHIVSSTSTVAFHAPFCDLGDDTGGSKAIHRVSALILYYFLAAGHVKELVRTRADPTMFTRSFRDACSWVENEGQRPGLLPSRRSSGAMLASQEPMPVRPKRSSTMTSFTRSGSDASYAPPIQRSATDSISIKVKREREESPAAPKKHPRRTLSEQIIIPKLQHSMFSPRSPAPERVNRALTERILNLKEENADLKDTIAVAEQETAQLQKRMAKRDSAYRHLQLDSEQTKTELASVKNRLSMVEEMSDKLRIEVESLKERLERAENGGSTRLRR
ncbi:hypothetical protein ACN47E_004855 [Coniothyrium glycines]